YPSVHVATLTLACSQNPVVMVSCIFFFIISILPSFSFIFFFFNDTATTEIYTLSLHDALPISMCGPAKCSRSPMCLRTIPITARSEEHTSELQSPYDLVCRLLLEKKKNHSYYAIRI